MSRLRSKPFLVVLVLIPLFALKSSAGAWAATPLKVMSFNIRYGTANDGPNSWEHRKDLVVDVVRKLNPDIVGMQECLKFQADYIDKSLPGYDHFGMGRNPDGSGERMEVFYRSEVLAPFEAGHFWLSETPEIPGSRSWRAANIRMATWVKFYHLEDRRFFSYLNTHFDHRSELARTQAARMIAQWADGRPGPSQPIVITGDFNAKAEEAQPWKILTQGLEDAWLAAGERLGPPVTWSGFEAPRDTVNRIDWILIGGPIHVIRCRTITYNVDGRYPSDHFPVLTDLEFRE